MAGTSSHCTPLCRTAGPEDQAPSPTVLVEPVRGGCTDQVRAPRVTGRTPGDPVPGGSIHRVAENPHPPNEGSPTRSVLTKCRGRQYVSIRRAAARRLKDEHLVVSPFAARSRERPARPSFSARHHGNRRGGSGHLLRPVGRAQRGLRERRRARRRTHGSRGAGDTGYGRPAADSGQYRVTAYLDGEKCRIEVSDSGPGFPARRALRPAAPSEQQHTWPALPARDAEAESGRGLDLIQQLSDHVQFGNRPGHGAVVRFDKVLKWREGALLTV